MPLEAAKKVLFIMAVPLRKKKIPTAIKLEDRRGRGLNGTAFKRRTFFSASFCPFQDCEIWSAEENKATTATITGKIIVV